jgi:hypothetical protein
LIGMIHPQSSLKTNLLIKSNSIFGQDQLNFY